VHFSLVLTSKSTELIGGLKHPMIGRKPSRMGLLCTSPILCFDLPRPIRAGFFDARIRLVLGLAAGCCENPRQPWSSAAELCHWGIQDSILATIRGPPPRLTVLSLCFVFKLRRLFSIKESLAMRPIWSASQLRRGLQQRHRTQQTETTHGNAPGGPASVSVHWLPVSGIAAQGISTHLRSLPA
jgi:hypothetical protein